MMDEIEREESIDNTPQEAENARPPKAVLEAILFSMGDSIELGQLASAIGKTPAATRKILLEMQEDFASADRGVQLLDLNGAWQFATKKEYFEDLIRIATHPRKPVLTDVVMETLSIIAYKQPVTKAEIEKIRGVSSDHAVNKLMDYGLVQELGRLEVPGRPILLGTTETFLRYFGMDSTGNLPELSPVMLEDFKAEAEAELDIKVEV